MFTFTEADWDKLEKSQKNSTLYLRFLRDAIARELISDLTWSIDEERAEKLITDLATFKSPESAYGAMKQVFIGNERFGYIDDLKVFRKVVYRIARLEREACHIPLYGDLLAA